MVPNTCSFYYIGQRTTKIYRIQELNGGNKYLSFFLTVYILIELIIYPLIVQGRADQSINEINLSENGYFLETFLNVYLRVTNKFAIDKKV